jgi:hypothetical protein
MIGGYKETFPHVASLLREVETRSVVISYQMDFV